MEDKEDTCNREHIVWKGAKKRAAAAEVAEPAEEAAVAASEEAGASGAEPHASACASDERAPCGCPLGTKPCHFYFKKNSTCHKGEECKMCHHGPYVKPVRDRKWNRVRKKNKEALASSTASSSRDINEDCEESRGSADPATADAEPVAEVESSEAVPDVDTPLGVALHRTAQMRRDVALDDSAQVQMAPMQNEASMQASSSQDINEDLFVWLSATGSDEGHVDFEDSRGSADPALTTEMESSSSPAAVAEQSSSPAVITEETRPMVVVDQDEEDEEEDDEDDCFTIRMSL